MMNNTFLVITLLITTVTTTLPQLYSYPYPENYYDENGYPINNETETICDTAIGWESNYQYCDKIYDDDNELEVLEEREP